MINIILIVISAILFLLAVVGIGIAGWNLTAWGLFFLAASMIPWRE